MEWIIYFYMVRQSNSTENLQKMKAENWSIKLPATKGGSIVINFNELIKRAWAQINEAPEADQQKIREHLQEWK